MSIFLTGSTGFLGGYTLAELLRNTDERFALLVRAKSERQAHEKLWKSLQLHVETDEFEQALSRFDLVYGDLHGHNLGMDGVMWSKVASECTSVLHIAASLNRKSSKACFNTNLRGTLSVIRLARAMADSSTGIRRYSHVSTVAVAGHRDREVVLEDAAVDWGRSDYDPYGRTKKFCEHMAAELLPDVSRVIFRPSIVMGDSRFPQTTQFDMVRAFCVMADLPVVPLSPKSRLDIVNADFVGRAIAEIHQKDQPDHGVYHLSSGTDSPTAGEIAEALRPVLRRPMRFAPPLGQAFDLTMRGLNRLPSRNTAQLVGALMKVFWPYITYDTVFDNSRICNELGARPTDFIDYAGGLYTFATQNRFSYPYLEYPD